MLVEALYKKLLSYYGNQNWWPAETPFEVCVGAILTQNTSWSNVEKAIKNLKEVGLLLPEKIVEADEVFLKSLIRPAGFYNQKAERLKILSKFLLDEGGIERLKNYSINTVREKLLSLKGVGKETADSIILYGLNKPIFVVDAYTKRLFYRYGLLMEENSDYEFVRRLVEKEIKSVKDLNEFHALIVVHCKELCKKKPLCSDCFLKDFCKKRGV